MVADGRSVLVALVLGEDTAQIGLAGFGSAVLLFSFSTGQFLLAHGQAGAVAADIKDRGVAGFRRRWTFLPGLGCRADPLDQSLQLAGANVNAAGFPQVFLSLFKAGGVGTLQADQPSQRRSVAPFQAQGGIGGKMAPPLFGIKIVVALDGEGTENALDLQSRAPLAMLSGLGLVGGIDPVGCLLKEKGDHLGGGFENGHAHQHLPLLGGGTADRPRAQAVDQLLEFGVLGRGDGRGEFDFFLRPAAMSARVRSMTCWACCSTSRW